MTSTKLHFLFYFSCSNNNCNFPQLAHMKKPCIIFIDDIDCLPRECQELLCSLMDGYVQTPLHSDLSITLTDADCYLQSSNINISLISNLKTVTEVYTPDISMVTYGLRYPYYFYYFIVMYHCHYYECLIEFPTILPSLSSLEIMTSKKYNRFCALAK